MVFKFLGIFFAWTWFIWALVSVFCLVSAITRSVQEAADGQDHKSGLYTGLAALSFAVIVGGLASLIVIAS